MNRPFFTTWSKQSQAPLFEILEGRGVRFRTPEGWWMDLASLSYQANLGHGHPAMVEAIKTQAEKFCLALPNHTFEAKERLAQRLLELAPPGFSKVFFTLGGSEAVENALKIAKLVTGRYKTVSRYRSYHGASGGALSLSGDYRRPPLEPLMSGALHALDCYCYRCPFGHEKDSCRLECATQFEHILTLEGKNSVGAVFCEPIPGANGVLIPPPGYWRTLREVCDRHGTLLVADEVLTGFGRTGRWFGIDHEEGVVPDMITLAKGLTGGYAPLGAVLVHQRVAEHFDHEKLYCGLTYYSHPLSCAAGERAVRLYEEEGLIEKAAALEKTFRTGLARIAEVAGGEPHEVRVRGLLGAVEWKNAVDSAWQPFFERLSGELVKARLHLYPKAEQGMIVMAPPLVISQAELEEGLEGVRGCVERSWRGPGV
ncbi:MAG: aminotransferase class III-fold pyridoxal phosphate-dependent enzyme [Vulcanimicrobiota bacterium]